MESAGRIKIFVLLPWQETVTLRHLSIASSLAIVQAELELLCGLPSDTFRLWFGHRELTSESLPAVGQLLRDGTTVSLRLKEDYCDVVQMIFPDKGNNACSLNGNTIAISNDYWLFTAAFLASFRGVTYILFHLLQRGECNKKLHCNVDVCI